MRPLHPLALLRRVAVGAGVTLVAVTLAALLWHLASTSSTPPSAPLRFDDLLVRASAVALLGCLAWAWSAVMVVVLESFGSTAVPEAAPAVLALPAGVRRLVLSLCGVALTVSTAPAFAGATADPGAGSARQEVPAVMAGLPFPDRAMDAGAATPARTRAETRAHSPGRHAAATAPAATGPAAATSSRDDSSTVTVAHGDSLWSIAADRIGEASDAEIARGWHELYAANRDVIGDDPALIMPEMQLELPGSLR